MTEPLPHPVLGGAFASPVQPGSGWPGDPTNDEGSHAWRVLDTEITTCTRCPRLVRWREDVARRKRAAYADQPYWGRPVAGFGSTEAPLLVVGLAPAAHGANRTGRMFTGDRSGDWLYAALHRAGLASQPTSAHAGDGLELRGCRVSAAVRCAPPGNEPTPDERDACAAFLDRELVLLRANLRVVLALGGFGWTAAFSALGRAGWDVPRPRPRFGHGAEVVLDGAHRPDVALLGCFHPSQQNTFTGRLTEPMLDAVVTRATEIAASPREH